MSFLLDNFVVEIVKFLQGLVKPDTGISFDSLFLFGILLEVVAFIFFFIKSMFSYEIRINRSFSRLNKWLFVNKELREDNLVDFNKRVRVSPKLLRYHWQQYMLYRENVPSSYMSSYNLLEKPIKTSSYESNVRNFGIISTAATFLLFIASLASYASSSTTLTLTALMGSCIIPLFMIILQAVSKMLLHAKRSANLNELYRNYYLYARFIDKACLTLPDYIDYEVLFSKEEITKGLPVLSEFLEKRALHEKMEFEKARKNAIEHEKFEFENAGINGELLLDRAMKETEYYLNIRNRVLVEIQQVDTEIENKKRNYEESQKEYQRKMQASRENVDRLRKELEETTNRIETNYIKKQQSDEIKKQEQLEKDFDILTRRFTQDIEGLSKEIEVKKADIEEKRQYVEQTMFAEYQTFSSKLYDSVSKVAEQNIFSNKELLLSQKIALESHVKQLSLKVRELETENKKLKGETNLENTVEDGRYDEEGNYVYSNGAYYDKNGIYHDEFGGFYDKDGTYYSKPKEEEVPISEEAQQDLKKSFGIGTPSVAAEAEDVESSKDFIKEPITNKVENIGPGDPQEKVQEEQPVVDVSKRKVGRPRKPLVEVKKPGKRGRPKKENVPKEPRRRGRPKKNVAAGELELINKQIEEENKNLNAKKQELNTDIGLTLSNVEKIQPEAEEKKEELMALMKFADELMKRADKLKLEAAKGNEIDKVNREIQELLERLNAYKKN